MVARPEVTEKCGVDAFRNDTEIHMSIGRRRVSGRGYSHEKVHLLAYTFKNHESLAERNIAEFSCSIPCYELLVSNIKSSWRFQTSQIYTARKGGFARPERPSRHPTEQLQGATTGYSLIKQRNEPETLQFPAEASRVSQNNRPAARLARSSSTDLRRRGNIKEGRHMHLAINHVRLENQLATGRSVIWLPTLAHLPTDRPSEGVRV